MTFMMSEKTVEDTILIEYGLEVMHLREAIVRHDLFDIPELKEMREAMENLKMQAQKKDQEKFQIPLATVELMHEQISAMPEKTEFADPNK